MAVSENSVLKTLTQRFQFNRLTCPLIRSRLTADSGCNFWGANGCCGSLLTEDDALVGAEQLLQSSFSLFIVFAGLIVHETWKKGFSLIFCKAL